MASRYHWVSGGVSISGAIPSATQTTNIAIPAGGIVKRFIGRGWTISAQKEATTYLGLVRPYYQSMDVFFSSGPNLNRHIYQSNRRIPCFWTAFEAVAIPVYDFQVNAGDNELGFNQRCSYGKSGGAAATLTFQTRFIPGSGSYAGDLTPGIFQYNFDVLYYL